MEKIKQVLEVLKSHPLMYLGEIKYQNSFDFLNGYTLGLQTCGFASETEILCQFHGWLYVRLKKNNSALNWSNLILKVKRNNKESAFDYFFELFDEFLNDSKKH